MENGSVKVGKLAVWISLLAGSMDSTTGVLLIGAPKLTLRLMGMDWQTEPLAYLQFIGAFVFAVGCLYLWGWLLLRRDRVLEWRILWVATAWARLCVGVTVTFLIASGRLSALWSSVPVADLGLAIVQLGYLRILAKADG